MPAKAKMKNHSFAVTAVGIAHGIRMLARSRPRPRKLRFMIIANHMPSTTSMRHRDDREEDGDEQRAARTASRGVPGGQDSSSPHRWSSQCV